MARFSNRVKAKENAHKEQKAKDDPVNKMLGLLGKVLSSNSSNMGPNENGEKSDDMSIFF